MTGIYILIGLTIIYAVIKLTRRQKSDSDELKEIPTDKTKDYHYSCLYNSLVLFAATPEYLKSLSGPVFAPIFELETDFDYAFGDFIFEQNFKNGKVNESLRNDLLKFKTKVDKTEPAIWTIEEIETNSIWQDIRNDANLLLDKLGEKRRAYDFGNTTIVVADNKTNSDNKT